MYSGRGRKSSGKRAVKQPQATQTEGEQQSQSSATSSAKRDRPKERVEGSGKVWGTRKSTSAITLSSTLDKLTSVSKSEVQVKRKYKQSNKKTVRWWFVVKGNEKVLCKLDSEWEKVSLETNWKLAPLLRYSDVDTEIHNENSPAKSPSSFLEEP